MSLAVGVVLPPVRVTSELNPLVLSDFTPGQVWVLSFFPAAFSPVGKRELGTLVGELAGYSREAVRAFGLALPSYYGMAEVANRAVFGTGTAGSIAWSWVAPDFSLEPSYAQVHQAGLAAGGS